MWRRVTLITIDVSNERITSIISVEKASSPLLVTVDVVATSLILSILMMEEMLLRNVGSNKGHIASHPSKLHYS
jgi:hypothetical protein